MRHVEGPGVTTEPSTAASTTPLSPAAEREQERRSAAKAWFDHLRAVLRGEAADPDPEESK